MHHRHWLLAGTFFTLTVATLAACVSDDDGAQSETDAGHDATADVVTAHDTGAPDTNVPVVDANVPDTNVPDTNTNVPDTNVADTNVADTNVADTNVADTNVADTNVADTSVKDSNVPDTNVADTSTADAADSASSACAPADAGDAGYATVAKPWSFAVSAATLNGGKGQVFTVNRCDTVIWTNQDTAPHSVVSTSAAFAFSTNQNNGGALTPVQFSKAGTFTYQCGVHGAMMIGEITVQ